MSHAPGPWKETSTQVSRRILDAHGESVCRIDHDVTADANARLISTAPDLLAALKRIIEHSLEDDDRLLMEAIGAGIVVAARAEVTP